MTSHPINIVASPLESARVIHQGFRGGWVSSAPSHERLGRRPMVRDRFVQEGPAWMCSNKPVDAFRGMGDCPGDKLVRALGMMAIPLEKAPCGLWVGMGPVTELARGLGVMLGPTFERHRR